MCSGCRPLVLGGRRAVVGGQPICAGCGTAAVPVGSGEWRHLADGEAYPYDSPWLRPPGWTEFAALTTFAAYERRCPDSGAAEDDWREARRRWTAYARRLSRAPLDELVAILAGRPVGPGPLPVPAPIARVLDLDGRRRELASRFAWAFPTPAAIGLIGDHGPVLEVGAGTGYWAAALRAAGVDVVATDASPFTNAYHPTGRAWSIVERLPAVEAVHVHPGRTLLLCWPPPDSDAAGYAAVRAYRGDTILYVGGDAGGPTGTARLHAELELNWTATDELALPWWPGIPDRLTVWHRNRDRRPLRARDRCPACARFVPTGASGRCERCRAADPAALTVDGIEYPAEALDAMPAALRTALTRSVGGGG